MKTFHDRHCFITGAASGIGRATALALAEQGAWLSLTDIQEAPLAAVCEAVRQRGGRVLASRALDIADYAAVRAFADDILGGQGSPDVLMNIAGISTWGTLENLAIEHWRQLLDINLMGPVHVLQSFVPAMIDAGRGGHIVNVSSAAGLFPLPWHAAYSATKFGLRGISEVLRMDLAHHRIGVSLVCPGAVDTGLVQTVNIVGVDRHDPDVRALVSRFQRHAVQPEQAARAILRGVQRKRFMVFTSADIRLGYWFQRKWAWPFEVVMRLINRQAFRLAQQKMKKGGK